MQRPDSPEAVIIDDRPATWSDVVRRSEKCLAPIRYTDRQIDRQIAASSKILMQHWIVIFFLPPVQLQGARRMQPPPPRCVRANGERVLVHFELKRTFFTT